MEGKYFGVYCIIIYLVEIVNWMLIFIEEGIYLRVLKESFWSRDSNKK